MPCSSVLTSFCCAFLIYSPHTGANELGVKTNGTPQGSRQHLTRVHVSHAAISNVSSCQTFTVGLFGYPGVLSLFSFAQASIQSLSVLCLENGGCLVGDGGLEGRICAYWSRLTVGGKPRAARTWEVEESRTKEKYSLSVM